VAPGVSWRAAVLTVSDRRSAGTLTDESGTFAINGVAEGHYEISAAKAELQEEVSRLKQQLAGESDALATQIAESILGRRAA